MILLVGTGYMGKEYAKVLKAMNLNFVAMGRSLANWLKSNKAPKTAIIAVTEDQLGNVTRLLINSGCKNILVEKPGGFDANDIKKVARLAKQKRAKVYVGYNRRFYASTQKALEFIKKESVLSFNFDFTERSSIIEKAPQSVKIKRGWFLQNSTHVIDMAFFLGGWPKKISSLKAGSISWHPSGAIYVGSGVTEKEALFAYHANWKSAGKWSVEIITRKTKLIFRPLEKLQIQKYGSMATEDYPLDDKVDIDFKPGLYRQVESFLGNKKFLPTIDEQVRHLKYYEQIKKAS